MNKLDLESNFDKVRVIPNSELHKVEPLNLSKVARTLTGKLVELRNIGRLIMPTDSRGFVVPDVTRNGWCMGTARHISTYLNCAVPVEEDKTFVVHESNLNTQDINNEAEAVLIPEKLLMFLYIHDKPVQNAELALQIPDYKDALENFLDHTLLRNGFLPENIAQKNKLHRFLEKEAIRIIAPLPNKGLERFKAVGPFANVRMEDPEPHKRMEDGFDDGVLYRDPYK